MRFAPIYAGGVAMGFTPQQVNDMSMWQYYAALNGFIEQNTPKGKEKLSDTEIDELSDWLDAGLETIGTLKTLVYTWGEHGLEVDKEVTFTLE